MDGWEPNLVFIDGREHPLALMDWREPNRTLILLYVGYSVRQLFKFGFLH